MFSEKYSSFAFILLGTIISCYFGFENNHPLVYEDSGAYLNSAFRNTLALDRPIFYGLFIRIASLGSSLWYVVFVQGLIICSLLHLTICLFFDGQKSNYIFIAVVTFLTLTTGFSYNVSMLLPDIFTPITILCLFNILSNHTLSRRQMIVVSIVFVFSTCTQFSTLLVLGLLILTLVVFTLIKFFKKNKSDLKLKRLMIAINLFVFSILLIPTTNYLISRKQFFISGSRHVFMMNHLVETGILEDYLRNNCEKHQYKLCDFKDNLSWNFMWSSESPLQKTGGWELNQKEYDAILDDIYTSPKYLRLLIQRSFEYTLKQLFVFEIKVSPPQLEASETYIQINWHYHNWMREYISSSQNQNNFKVNFINAIQQPIILISFVFLFCIFLSKQLFNKLGVELKWLLMIVLLHNFLNAFICSNFSTVHPRFQNRVVWLFPFLVALIVLKYWEIVKKEKTQ